MTLQQVRVPPTALLPWLVMRGWALLERIGGHEMAEIVSIKERQRQLDHDWGLELVIKKRKALLRSAPLSPEIAELDRWLVTQPLSTRDLIKIWSHMIRVLLIEYADAVDDRKREILLSLRSQYRAMPRRIQEELWEIWFRWLDEWEEERPGGA
jgi:hypothetical protein